MIKYVHLKENYMAATQIGLLLAAGYEEAKRGNELIHALCDKFIDKNYYSEADKLYMKLELALVKAALDIEIDACFRGAF